MPHRSEFINGVKDTLPLIIGAIPFGIAFGVLGVTEAGLSPAATIGMSLFVFAGSAQFIAAGLLAQNAGIALIVLTTWIVNVRHVLYGASLGVYVRQLSQRWLLPLAFWLTDETYAVVIRRYARADDIAHKHWYFLGSAVAMYTNWQLCTMIGIIAGSQLEGVAEWGLDFAMVVTFIGIVVPLVINRPLLVCAIVAGFSALLLDGIPHRLGLVIAAIIGMLAGYFVETYMIDTSKRVEKTT
ncbi:MAG: branched-chain amino acid ABC transporter permease [Phototrophicales bacterium]|nr:MAG: branched-chain amino acid ABC transporter permease [Phototrophicales bacterium]